jgi:hypothetical protein
MKRNLWFFDTEAGKKEILFRRIGRNELSAIRVCQELVAAQKEYYAIEHNEYAKQIYSDEGQHNGLYWKASDGEPRAPSGLWSLPPWPKDTPKAKAARRPLTEAISFVF